MDFKKWIIIFILAMFCGLILLCTFNYIVDPFGVFGDKFLKWYSFDMVNNPRVAKIGYLDQFNNRYDSYVIGGSKSSSINPAILDKYYGNTSFYSMMMYGGDFYDYEKTMYYLVENYEVKNIVLHISMHEIDHYKPENPDIKNELSAKVSGESLIKFYFKYLTLNLDYSFEKLEGLLKKKIDEYQYFQIRPKDGVYNKTLRDQEDLGTKDEFLAKYPEYNNDQYYIGFSAIDSNIESLKRMKNYCVSKGIHFTAILAPTYFKEMNRYEFDKIKEYIYKIAQVTDFWNFSGYNTVSYDPRNFYDPTHYRNSVGEMILARIFEDNTIEVLENFGCYVTSDNVESYLENFNNKP